MIFVDFKGWIYDKDGMEIPRPYIINAHKLHSVRHWERLNLPHYGKEVGYLMFLELAKSGGVSADTLKSFYLSMPYAESTVRLLIRHLENDGWIQIARQESDNRIRKFLLTEKFQSKQDEWIRTVEQILSE